MSPRRYARMAAILAASLGRSTSVCNRPVHASTRVRPLLRAGGWLSFSSVHLCICVGVVRKDSAGRVFWEGEGRDEGCQRGSGEERHRADDQGMSLEVGTAVARRAEGWRVG
eukprot:1899590-Alexandrium_andersonii.AAC.1